MPAVVDVEACNGCKSCEEACPTQSIKVGDDNIAHVTAEECIDCNACEAECGSAAVKVV